MVPNSVILARKCPLLFRFVGHYIRPSSRACNEARFPAVNSIKISFRSCSSCTFHSMNLNSPSVGNTVSKELGRSGIGLRQLGYDCFRIAAVSNDGSGGTGRYGGSNFGGSGGNGDGNDGGGSKWSFFSRYLSLLEKYPVWTKAVTSAILTFVGDLICQLLIDQMPYLELKRISLFTFLGLVLVGPTLHFWYLYLTKLVTVTGASGAFLRLILDQFLFAPIFIGVFLSTLVTLEGRPLEVMPKLRQEWFSSVLVNWQLWIPFQFLNFRFVPQRFQVLAANFIALVWNVILSYKAHKEIAK